MYQFQFSRKNVRACKTRSKNCKYVLFVRILVGIIIRIIIQYATIGQNLDDELQIVAPEDPSGFDFPANLKTAVKVEEFLNASVIIG